MRLGGRLGAAIDILQTITTNHRPVSEALKDWGKSHRFAGSGDRSAIGNIVYDALRMKLSHSYMMDDDSPQALGYAVLFRQWHVSPEELASQFSGDKFAPDALSQEQLSAFASRKIEEADLHVQADLPQWLLETFQNEFGEDWLEEAYGLNGRPSLDLRVNSLKTSQEKALAALAKAGVRATDLAPLGMRVDVQSGGARLPNVTAELSFSKGWFEVQDEGSQLAASLVGAIKGEQVLDYCAGGGGKALALSAEMENGGQVHAFDSDSRRMSPMIERLRRAGTRNVQICETPEALEPLVESCDRVLVDAPCTGAGTWRRRPDAKWRLFDKNLQMRMKQQREAIMGAAKYVKSGGCLTYVTCSVLREENDMVVEEFLAQNSQFKHVDLSVDWSQLTGQDVAPKSQKGLGVLCTPRRTKTDGFFIARLEKQ